MAGVHVEQNPDAAGGLVASARRVVVLSGAGISTDSGIPDYRGPNGVWTKNPEAERNATLSVYLREPEVRVRAWRRRLEWDALDPRPNPGHHALVDLERQGRLHTLVTQNIDGLHQAAGSDPGRVIEIHGTIHDYVCMSCDRRGPMGEVLARVQAGEDDPPCEHCGGILKSATISFGQALVWEDLDRALEAVAGADLFLTVGTSLAVSPINQSVFVAADAGVPIVIVNGEPTEFDALAAAVVRDPISDVLPRLVSP
ncbi:MAG: NAD-dependent deacetylase [Acidimicrobiales bacterium]|jgi:NAD-dependent deacetylase|nr:NAD-dependent deacetylase [Acidimicrobiales bacterium]